MKLTVSPRLEMYLPDEINEKMFVAYRGNPMRLPEKFGPEEEYLNQLPLGQGHE
jgi:hypothetical protein